MGHVQVLLDFQIFIHPLDMLFVCVFGIFWGESPTAIQGDRSLPLLSSRPEVFLGWGKEEGILTRGNMEPEFCVSRMFSRHVLMNSNHVASGKANTVLVYIEIAISSLAALSIRPFPSPLF